MNYAFLLHKICLSINLFHRLFYALISCNKCIILVYLFFISLYNGVINVTLAKG
jgi:hypothetical protein